MAYNSPCLSCTRVRDPKNCENKTCKDWQAWFIDRWEGMRESVRRQMAAAPVRESGVTLAGKTYAAPDRVRQYLDQDPCISCLCPKNICLIPCAAKQIWATAVERSCNHELES